MNKKIYKSKTMWVALILPFVALLAPHFAPGIQDFAQTNPEAFTAVLTTALSLIFAGLRLITKGQIDIGITDDDLLSEYSK